ncbi:MAG: folate-binding protein YgfZ [Rhizobiaceae bacterium]
MTSCKTAELTDRTLVRIAGEDATHFLQGLVTCEVETLKTGEGAFGALLSPQGKILFDFFLIRSVSGYLADVARAVEPDFIRRLTFYRLRARVEIEPMDKRTGIHAAWDGAAENVDGIAITDPRLAALGQRLYCRRPPKGTAGDYRAHRLAHGMPQGGEDFAFGACFPHEVLMDQFGGVDFTKGCYVGQEVVSRMQHRGTARSRFIMVESTRALPPANTDILAGGKPAGTMGSSHANKGLALLRLDKVGDALAAGKPILAGSQPISVHLQSWVNFTLPVA